MGNLSVKSFVWKEIWQLFKSMKKLVSEFVAIVAVMLVCTYLRRSTLI